MPPCRHAAMQPCRPIRPNPSPPATPTWHNLTSLFFTQLPLSCKLRPAHPRPTGSDTSGVGWRKLACERAGPRVRVTQGREAWTQRPRASARPVSLIRREGRVDAVIGLDTAVLVPECWAAKLIGISASRCRINSIACIVKTPG